MKFISFYSRSSNIEHRYLSNFTLINLQEGNNTFPSVEHFFQATKYNYTIRKNNEIKKFTIDGEYGKIPPNKIKRFGGKKYMKGKGQILNITKWNNVRKDIMTKIIKNRFNSDEKFRNIILDLLKQNYKIIHFEYSNSVPYWGRYFDKKSNKFIGNNVLGEIIMKCIFV